MKTICGNVLSEDLAKLYRYAFLDGGDRQGAYMMAEANNLKNELAALINSERQTIFTLRSVFEGSCNYFILSFVSYTDVIKNRCISGLYSFTLTPIFYPHEFKSIKGVLGEKNYANKYRIGTIAQVFDIPKENFLSLAKKLRPDTFIKALKIKADKIMLKNKLPKIDWAVVKINLIY